ncbi:Scr1 family TA system antitoxin-like transcriptional regulator [Micromonospora sp. NBC_01699]|uniref:Scr1 family TA system antitoxin-like transcriptional regulator n=1 Tax=Micromonospora sp. NBC_01699 TaxID=2975984 RepID=UPI003FA58909
MGLESAADELQNFETIVVTGHLQTEEYARAIASGGATQPAPEAIEQRVAARLDPECLHRGPDRRPLRRRRGCPALYRRLQQPARLGVVREGVDCDDQEDPGRRVPRSRRPARRSSVRRPHRPDT